ncbi:MAG: hypothetical protein ABIB11_02345 [Candidatus Omnitrophota bacterium]
MFIFADRADRKKLLDESYVLLERLRKLRALDADPRLLGINRRVPGVDSPRERKGNS